jgi:hypothetical protein
MTFSAPLLLWTGGMFVQEMVVAGMLFAASAVMRTVYVSSSTGSLLIKHS